MLAQSMRLSNPVTDMWGQLWLEPACKYTGPVKLGI
jgi:hypothetical protein